MGPEAGSARILGGCGAVGEIRLILFFLARTGGFLKEMRMFQAPKNGCDVCGKGVLTGGS